MKHALTILILLLTSLAARGQEADTELGKFKDSIGGTLRVSVADFEACLTVTDEEHPEGVSVLLAPDTLAEVRDGIRAAAAARGKGRPGKPRSFVDVEGVFVGEVDGVVGLLLGDEGCAFCVEPQLDRALDLLLLKALKRLRGPRQSPPPDTALVPTAPARVHPARTGPWKENRQYRVHWPRASRP